PPAALYRITNGVGHFYTREASLELPAGEYEIVTMRGTEYRPDQRTFEITAGREFNLEITLSRWTNLAAQGWYSGENHVHANYGYGAWYNTPETVFRQCLGEDLAVCNAVVANSDGDGVYDREFFRGEPDSLSTSNNILYWNQEFRSTMWGHLTLSNLSQLVEPVFTGFLETTNPWDVPTNGDIAGQTHDQNGLVSYTHPAANFLDLYDQPYAAKGLPVDAALGRIDVMDVMGNTYKGSVLLWYKLLNCGIRIAASAGTDCFLNRVTSYPPGWGRTYVHLEDPLTYARWTEGEGRGRSFITNGPALQLEVAGSVPGESVTLERAGPVSVVATARSHFAIEKLELVLDGRVVAKGEIDPDGRSGRLAATIEIGHSGWLALRAEGPPAPYVLRKGLYAHTNPVYLELGGAPPEPGADPAFFLRWIDRLEADFTKRSRVPTEAARRHVLAQLESARGYYRRLLPAP
ncbi:MAG: CehA/McbA family metallohydrolase, partial [Verrucomicrobiales bacterium]